MDNLLPPVRPPRQLYQKRKQKVEKDKKVQQLRIEERKEQQQQQQQQVFQQKVIKINTKSFPNKKKSNQELEKYNENIEEKDELEKYLEDSSDDELDFLIHSDIVNEDKDCSLLALRKSPVANRIRNAPVLLRAGNIFDEVKQEEKCNTTVTAKDENVEEETDYPTSLWLGGGGIDFEDMNYSKDINPSPLHQAFMLHKNQLLNQIISFGEEERHQKRLGGDMMQLELPDKPKILPRIQVINAGNDSTCQVYTTKKKTFGVVEMKDITLPPGSALFGDNDWESESNGSFATIILRPRVMVNENTYWAPRVGDNVRSLKADSPIIIEFQNFNRRKRVNLYWIDYQGNHILRHVIKPGELHAEQTFATHPWFLSVNRCRTPKELLIVCNSEETSTKNKQNIDNSLTESILWQAKQFGLSIMPIRRNAQYQHHHQQQQHTIIKPYQANISIAIC